MRYIRTVHKNKQGHTMNKKEHNKPVSFLKALMSVFSGAIGIQKRDNMERDLKRSNLKVFIMAGIIFLIVFVASIITVVSMVVPETR